MRWVVARRSLLPDFRIGPFVEPGLDGVIIVKSDLRPPVSRDRLDDPHWGQAHQLWAARSRYLTLLQAGRPGRRSQQARS